MRKTFTLVEMVVVIAIIAILASLLLPALKGARDAAKSSICLGNLRQCGTGAFQYADDNLEWLPHCGNTGGGYPSKWTYTLYSGNYLKYSVMVCPSEKPFTTSPDVAPAANAGYGVELWNNKASGVNWSDGWTRMTKLKAPSGYVWLADSVNPTGYGDPTQICWLTANNTALNGNFAHRRHKLRANTFLLDGHVEAMDKTALIGLNQQCFYNSYPF